ncbi:MAG: tRNA (N6-threonylcarbamoyladenosine(37)-N6)-methyltransferase TrmO [Bacteroidota bacterium]
MNNIIKYNPIGIINTPFTKLEGMPIQPAGAKGVKGTVELKPEYIKGLKDIEGFSYIILIYHFHLSKDFSLEVIPFLDDKPHGLFTTRAPNRPNPIGISTVRLVKVAKNKLYIEDVDIINGTPLLDIKPFIPGFDSRSYGRTGWLTEEKNFSEIRSDKRFKY